MKRPYLPILYIIIVAAIVGIIVNREQKNEPNPTPTPTETPTPRPENPLDDLIQVLTPHPEETVSSPLTITGKARGTWYFEASFPAILKDENGTILAQMPVQAQGDWMTEDFVPFSLSMTFSEPTTATGTLILQKDNPSGLPENDEQLEIPVRFAAYE